MELRIPSVTDLGRLQAIEDAADARFVERFEPEVWWPAPPGEERVASPGFVFVAAETESGEPVGFVHVIELDRLAHLEQLSVLPDHGGQGLGRALVEAALSEAAARGYERMSLRTYAEVPWNAPFYRGSGFVESDPDEPFLRDLVAVEERLGLHRYGRRIQMTADLRQGRRETGRRPIDSAIGFG